MHHVTLDQWSRRQSPLHRLDPRSKIVALLVLLVVVGTANRQVAWLCGGLWVLLGATALIAHLPLRAMLIRACVVLPFTGVFAAVSWLAGDPGRGAALVMKSYVSAFAVLILVSTTALPALLRGFERLGAPRFLLMVAQFLYRYLFVISEEAQHMRKAAQARGASAGGLAGGLAGNAERFSAAAGALAVLFARSYHRAEQIHRAMLSRSFPGYFRPLMELHYHPADLLFVMLGVLLPVLLRVWIERLS